MIRVCLRSAGWTVTAIVAFLIVIGLAEHKEQRRERRDAAERQREGQPPKPWLDYGDQGWTA